MWYSEGYMLKYCKLFSRDTVTRQSSWHDKPSLRRRMRILPMIIHEEGVPGK